MQGCGVGLVYPPAPGRARTLTDGHELDTLTVQELERHGHVLELHLAEGGPLVVFAVHALLAEHFQQRDKPQPITQVGLQVPDAFVHALEVLVAPTRERVLLYLLPWRVLRQVLFSYRHPRGGECATRSELPGTGVGRPKGRGSENQSGGGAGLELAATGAAAGVALWQPAPGRARRLAPRLRTEPTRPPETQPRPYPSAGVPGTQSPPAASKGAAAAFLQGVQ